MRPTLVAYSGDVIVSIEEIPLDHLRMLANGELPSVSTPEFQQEKIAIAQKLLTERTS